MNNATSESAQQLTELNNKVAGQLRDLSGNTGYVTAGAGAAIALPSKTLSSAMFFNSYADIEAFADVNASDLTSYTINGVTLQVPTSEENVSSKVVAMGALVSDFGISLAKSFDTSLGNTSVGVSPKIQQIRVLNYVATAVDSDFDDVTDDQYQTKKNGFNMDVGVANDFGNGWTTGLAVKNLFKRDVTSPWVNGVQAEYELAPIPTVSATYQHAWLTVSGDLDLVPQKRFTRLTGTTAEFDASDDDLQMASVGIEGDVLGWMQLRAGYRHDLKGNLDDAFTAGIGISPFKTFHLDVAGVYGGSNELGGVVQTAYTF